MKVLLRKYGSNVYVWRKAKYNRGKFIVHDCEQTWTNVVAVINDNRKNYVQCSSCGQTFKRDDPKFEEHKAKAISPETCFECDQMYVEDNTTTKSKFFIRPDGTIGEKVENIIYAKCTLGRTWLYPDIRSDDAICSCAKRKCANATTNEIKDFFTDYPGAFDDIITIDRLLDAGHDVGLSENGENSYDIVWTDDYEIGVIINKIGIVDRFYVWFRGDKHEIYYSRRYNKLFTSSYNNYVEWTHVELSTKIEEEIKAKIREFYY